MIKLDTARLLGRASPNEQALGAKIGITKEAPPRQVEVKLDARLLLTRGEQARGAKIGQFKSRR